MADKTVQLRLLISAINRAGSTLVQTSEQLRTIGAETAKVNAQSAKMGAQGAASVGKWSKSLDGLKSKMQGLTRAGDAMVGMGTRLAAAGAALASTAIFPIKAAADFERAMAEVRAVTKGSDSDFAALEKRARDLAARFPKTTKEVAEGIKLLGQAGLDAKEAFVAIEPALKLSTVGMISMAEASDHATNIMSAFEQEAEDLPHIMDVLAETAANSNTNVSQLALALSYVGTNSNAAGISLEETAATIGILSSRGIQASRAGTAMRAMLASLQDPSKEAQAALENLGAIIAENDDGSLNFTKTLQNLRDAGIDSKTAFQLFNRIAAGAGISLAKASDEVAAFTKQIKNSDGAMDRMYRIIQDNLIGSMQNLRSAVDETMVSFGEPLLKASKGFIEAITAIVRAIGKWAKEHPKLAKAITLTTLVLGGLLAVIGAILIPLGLMASGFGSLATGVLAVAGFVTSTLVPAFIALKAALIGAATASAVLLPLLVAMAAAWGVMKIYEAIKAFREMRSAQDDLWETSKRGIELGERLQSKWKEFADVEIKGPVSDLGLDELKEFDLELRRSRAYWMGVQTELQARSNEKTFLGTMTADAKEAKKQLEVVGAKLSGVSQIRRRVLQEINARETELTDAVTQGTEKQIVVKKKLTDIEKRRLAQVKQIQLATEAIEISAQGDSAGKIEAQRKLEVKRFLQSEDAKTLVLAGATEERNKRILAINAKYAVQLEALQKREADKVAQQVEKTAALELQIVELNGERQLMSLEKQYEDGLISLDEYMKHRREIMDRETDLQLESLKAKLQLATEEDRPIIELEIAVKEMEAETQMEELLIARDEFAAELIEKEENLQSALRDIRMRSLGEGQEEKIASLELKALAAKHAQEIRMLEDLGATRAEIEAAQNNQSIEATRAAADAEKAIYDMRKTEALSALSLVQTAFGELTAASGKESKEAFYAQKAIAIATTLMNTYDAAMKAFNGLAQIPYIGVAMGTAAATVVTAAGLAKVAQIRAQRVAAGGEIGGRSPNSRADNIPIMATAKEFMLPVDAAKYYGKNILEGMRRKMIPKEVFAGMQIPQMRAAAHYGRYATGGSVTEAKAREESKQVAEAGRQEIKILNYVDPQEFVAAISSPEGERTVVNIISKNSEKIQRVLR